jgi:hypothetical protein
MIESNTEHNYDIILSFFLGIIIAILFDFFYQKPHTSIIYKK